MESNFFGQGLDLTRQNSSFRKTVLLICTEYTRLVTKKENLKDSIYLIYESVMKLV